MEKRTRLSFGFIGVYFFIKFLPSVAAFFWIIFTGEYKSEFEYAKLKVQMPYENIYLIFFSFLFCLFLVTIFFLFYLQCKKFVLLPQYSFSLDRKKIELYLSFVIFLNFFLLFKTGNGLAGGEYNRSSLSSILALLNYEFFFWIYFINYFEQRNKTYYFITILYIGLNLVQGWSSFVISFFFVLVCLVKKKYQKFIFLLVPLAFFIGGGIYTFLYPFKNLIRFGRYIQISYGEGLLHLLMRLTNFPNACVAVQNQNKILDLYYGFNSESTEFLSYFYRWMPGFLMPNKSTRVFANLVMLSVYPNYPATQSAGMGFTYGYMLIKLGFIYFLLYITVFTVTFIVTKFFSDNLINSKKAYVNYLPFIMIFNITTGIDFRMLGGKVTAIFTFFIFLFFGIVKVRHIRRQPNV